MRLCMSSVVVAIAGVCACVVSALLILVLPVRCVVTVTVPSLGTKEGRKIFLSVALFCAISVCVRTQHDQQCRQHPPYA
ncbi:hypothetical protein P4O66_013566 [Electrophorus voltai]|uniref:Uncharacterized protein n=1 Tax=Electrophorus voltai TaxID=2609070 RepID=A0AAD8Z2Q1_9TELE|nr:hypothetical protein P4O66_013566 [Electrophorus voltai]